MPATPVLPFAGKDVLAEISEQVKANMSAATRLLAQQSGKTFYSNIVRTSHSASRATISSPTDPRANVFPIVRSAPTAQVVPGLDTIKDDDVIPETRRFDTLLLGRR